MGLDITGMYSDKDYHYGYTALHLVRFLAVKTINYDMTYEEFHKQQSGPTWEYENKFTEKEKADWKPIWEQYPQFHQLLHFSDAEGMMIPEWFLRNVDYENSFNLGNLTKLVAELEQIKDAIAREPEKYNNEALETWPIKPFWSLYDLATEELESNGIIVFH